MRNYKVLRPLDPDTGVLGPDYNFLIGTEAIGILGLKAALAAFGVMMVRTVLHVDFSVSSKTPHAKL